MEFGEDDRWRNDAEGFDIARCVFDVEVGTYGDLRPSEAQVAVWDPIVVEPVNGLLNSLAMKVSDGYRYSSRRHESDRCALLFGPIATSPRYARPTVMSGADKDAHEPDQSWCEFPGAAQTASPAVVIRRVSGAADVS